MAEKKKLLRVVGWVPEDEDVYNDASYANKYPQFSMMSSPEDGRRQCFEFYSCRDYIHEMLGAHVGSKNMEHSDYEEDMPPVDFTRLRLLVQYGEKKTKDAFKEKLFSAKRILNHYEALAGWKQSVITTVKHDKYKYVWLITGPGEWMAHPNLVSIVTLILRFAAANGPIEFTDQASLDKAISKICKSKSKIDVCYMATVHNKLPVIIKNYDKIFNRGSLKAAYTNTSGHGNHPGGGIYSLCTYSSLDKDANTALRKIIEK